MSPPRQAPWVTDDNGVAWIDEPSLDEWVLLCVDSRHPIDPGNYPGPIHCTAHPDGHACVTARYARLPHTTMTEAERNRTGVTGDAHLKARLFGWAREFARTNVAWRGLHAYRDLAVNPRLTPSLDDVRRALDDLVADGVLERHDGTGGQLWRMRP